MKLNKELQHSIEEIKFTQLSQSGLSVNGRDTVERKRYSNGPLYNEKQIPERYKAREVLPLNSGGLRFFMVFSRGGCTTGEHTERLQ